LPATCRIGLDLGRAPHARDGKPDVDGGPDAGEEQVRLEVDLAVGDRDDVRRDIGRHVAELGLDDRQGRQGAAAQVVIELPRALEQARVEVEHVAGIGLASGRPAQQERKLAVRRGVLGQVVVDTERVLLAVAEVLAHRAAGIGGDVLQRRRFRGRRDDHGGVGHGARVLEDLHHLGHRRALLPDGDVDAEHVLALLVDDRVDADGGLARLAVADDQLALPASDGDHGVDGLEARLERLLHGAPVHDARRIALDIAELLGFDRSLAVDGLPEGIHHAPDERRGPPAPARCAWCA
jgi:hypothetical protein